MSKIFLDTNILLYTLDENDKDKQKNARKIVQTATEQDTPVISTQILQEFYVASTSKLGVEPLLAKSIVHSFENMEVVRIDPYLIGEAILRSAPLFFSRLTNFQLLSTKSLRR